MKLHARNLAISVGIPPKLVNDAVKYMLKNKSITQEKAQEFWSKIQMPLKISDEVKL